MSPDPRTFSNSRSLLNPSVKPTMTKSLGFLDGRSRSQRSLVEKAVVEHKIFTCFGTYPAIRHALKKRGWVEKVGPSKYSRSVSAGPSTRPRSRTERGDKDKEESDTAWISRALRDYSPDFLWVVRRDGIDWKSLQKDQIINRFPKAGFTTKVGITACLQQMHWYCQPGFSETFFPRCYRLSLEDEKSAFQEDFRLTACMSYLKHFMEQVDTKGAEDMVDTQSKITPLSIDFASRQLQNYIKVRKHEDIDWLLSPNIMSQHWDAFIYQYYMVVHEKKKIRCENVDQVKIKYDIAKKTLQRVNQYWPQGLWDGVYNIWICKPGAKSRGIGIVIMNNLDKILNLVTQGNFRESNWVVQKYMERPMLIHKTKFDIRQWFIVTDWAPLTIWFYKESYIRFSSKPFVLNDFHESVHLTNNAIQCRYKNAASRDRALPDENMWDCYTFQAHLKTVGKLDQWPKIYSGMKQAIIGVLLASQETVDGRKNSFELYGADFMLSEDCTPWLIEINSCPCMASTTSITARMCAQCLEDTIKVVIDRRHNKNADTGSFELIYRQPLSAVTVSQFTGHDLAVHGKKLTRDIEWPGTAGVRNLHRRSTVIPTSRNPLLRSVSRQAETLTFSDLLNRLRMKNTQLFQNYMNNSQSPQIGSVSSIMDTVSDNSTSTTLLAKMKAFRKSSEGRSVSTESGNSSDTDSLKKLLPPVVTAGTTPEASLANLSRYFEETGTTFANLVKISKESEEVEEDNGNNNNSNLNHHSKGSLPPISNGESRGNSNSKPKASKKAIEEVKTAVKDITKKVRKSTFPVSKINLKYK